MPSPPAQTTLRDNAAPIPLTLPRAKQLVWPARRAAGGNGLCQKQDGGYPGAPSPAVHSGGCAATRAAATPAQRAWGDAADSSRLAHASLAGPLLLKCEDVDTCLITLRAPVAPRGVARFVSCRIGPIVGNGLVSKECSIKAVADWAADCDLQWAVKGVPLSSMARRSPIGLVGCRFKVWAQGRMGRRWVGRSLPISVPTAEHDLQIGDIVFSAEARCGSGASWAAVIDGRFTSPEIQVVPDVSAPALALWEDPSQELRRAGAAAIREQNLVGAEILRVVAARQWGIALGLLNELRGAPQEWQSLVLSETDATGRTALRHCVDAQGLPRPPRLQALERGELNVVLDRSQPYWWSLKIESVCHRSSSFLGEFRIGVPYPRSTAAAVAAAASGAAPPGMRSAGDGVPAWRGCHWSEPQPCRGQLEDLERDPKEPGAFCRVTIEGEADLTVRLVGPGASASFGTGHFRNPLAVRLAVVHGKVADTAASGLFDAATSARLAAERELCGPREVAELAVAAGADPRALAEDGMSPYTAAIFGQDPCGLLRELDPALCARMAAGDPHAWAEAGRSRSGSGLADLVAAPLVRGLPVPCELAAELLDLCFGSELPLLAMRALTRADGSRHLLTAVERAAHPHWLRVAERIMQMNAAADPQLCSSESIGYTIEQIQQGRSQFRRLLEYCLRSLRGDDDFYATPATLPSSGGAECPICFDPLCRGVPVAFAEDDGRAVCSHFICKGCAKGHEATANASGAARRCPECRRQAPKTELLPSLGDDPLGWFDFLKSPESGTIPRSALLRAISAMLPVDAEALGKALDAGTVTSSEVGHDVAAVDFLTGGLYSWVWRHEAEHRRCSALGPAPPLSDRAAWFEYWNLSKSGSLSQGEALRAVMRALGASSLDKKRLQEIRRRFDRLWTSCCDHIKRKSGSCRQEEMTLPEFSCLGGLADLIEEEFSADPQAGGGFHGDPRPEEPSSRVAQEKTHFDPVQARFRQHHRMAMASAGASATQRRVLRQAAAAARPPLARRFGAAAPTPGPATWPPGGGAAAGGGGPSQQVVSAAGVLRFLDLDSSEAPGESELWRPAPIGASSAASLAAASPTASAPLGHGVLGLGTPAAVDAAHISGLASRTRSSSAAAADAPPAASSIGSENSTAMSVLEGLESDLLGIGDTSPNVLSL